jgi:Fe-S-cluster containining protein
MGKLMFRNGKIVRIATLPVTSCNNCGACCRHMGAPLDYEQFVYGEQSSELMESGNYNRWLDMPEALKSELKAYFDGVRSGAIPAVIKYTDKQFAAAVSGDEAALEIIANSIMEQTPNKAIACIWYDQQKHTCKNYEWRPDTCRDALEPGDEACLATRKAFRIPLPVAK